MRHIVFLGALIVSFELLGPPIANAIPANGNALVKGNSSVIQIMAGCGWHQKPNRRTGKCESI
jgi:hypothetical protein